MSLEDHENAGTGKVYTRRNDLVHTQPRSLDRSPNHLVIEVKSAFGTAGTRQNIREFTAHPASERGGKARRQAARWKLGGDKKGRAGRTGFGSFASGTLCQLFSSAALLAYG